MSDARPITNVTEYVCGACWNGFGADDPGVRGSDGSLTCPHCGHLQALAGGHATTFAEALAGRPEAADPEISFADTLPGASAPAAYEESSPVAPSALIGSIGEAAGVVAADAVADGAAPQATSDPPPSAPAPAPAARVEASLDFVAGDAELGVDIEEDTPVAGLLEPDAAAAPVAVAPAQPAPDPPRTLRTAEELLAFLDAAEDQDIDDALFGATLNALPPVSADAVAGSGDDADAAAREVDTTEVKRPRVSRSQLPVAAMGGAAARVDEDDRDTADDDESAIVSENTSPDLQVADLTPEPTEWKLRAPPGLTYNFHSVDALLGWASNRSTDGLQVSIDGQTWRPVGPFLQALRGGHRGRKAFALAQVPDVVASMRDGSRTALDDIRDVDVRDEVLRTLESRTGAPPAAPELVMATPASRKSRKDGAASSASVASASRASTSSMAAATAPAGLDDAGADADALEQTQSVKRPTMRSLPQVAGAALDADAAGGRRPSGVRPAADAGRPSGERRCASAVPRTTGEQRVGAELAAKGRPTTSATPVATGRTRPTSAKHIPAARIDSGMSTAAKIGVAVAVLVVIAGVAALHVTGVYRLPLP